MSWPSFKHISFLLADCLELDASLPAESTLGAPIRDRYIASDNRLGTRAVPVVRVSRDDIHSRHGLPKPTGMYLHWVACFPSAFVWTKKVKSFPFECPVLIRVCTRTRENA